MADLMGEFMGMLACAELVWLLGSVKRNVVNLATPAAHSHMDTASCDMVTLVL